MRASGYVVYEFTHPQPCRRCGDRHRYLTFNAPNCPPIVFPAMAGDPLRQRRLLHAYPGGRWPGTFRMTVTAGNVEQPEDSLLARLTERVAAGAIRCEACGEVFEELARYADHECGVRYR